MDFTENKRSRRSMIKSVFAGLVTAGASMLGVAQAKAKPSETGNNAIKHFPSEEKTSKGQAPLFSGTVVHNDLVYVSGIGYHKEGDITKATTEVLNKMEEKLDAAGSSMEHVLKANVYLADLADYDKMNDAYRGRFGDHPGVRTTVATYGGVPGDSLVEIDCIAALK